MPGTTPSPVAYSGVVDEAVIQDSMRGHWDNTVQQIAILDYLKARGRINSGGDGKYLEMRARVGRRTKTQRSDLAARTFSRHQDRTTYSWPWSFHEVNDILSMRDVMFLNGSDYTVRDDLLASRLTEIGDDFMVGLHEDLMTNNAGTNTVFGQAADAGSGDNPPFQGLPTVFQYGSSASAYNPVTQAVGGGVAATDKEVAPSGTYGNVTLGPVTAISGVNGKVNESTSPVLVNWSSTAWDSSGSSTTFLANAPEALKHLITRLTRGSGGEGMRPDVGFMDENLFVTFQNSLEALTNRQLDLGTEPKAPDVGMFPRFWIPYMGVKFHMDRQTPPNAVYVLNTKKADYKYFKQPDYGEKARGPMKGKVDQMFHIEAQYDIDVGGWKLVVSQACQFYLNPFYQGAAYNFA